MFETIGMITITVIIYIFLTLGLSMVFTQDCDFFIGWFFGMGLFVLAACLWITGTPFPVT